MNWTLHPAAAFDTHATDWQRLNVAGPDSPVLHPDFVAPLVKTFAGPRTRLAVGTGGHAPRAMLLLVRTGAMGWSTFQPSQAPIGLTVADPTLQRRGLWQELLRVLPGAPLTLSITQQDPEFSPRPSDSGTLRTLDYIDTARIVVDGSFDAYWKSRGRNLRHNIDRQRHRLAREGIRLRLETLSNCADMTRAIADYGRLESAGWKAQKGTAITADNDQGRFYHTMLQNFAARGEARVDRLFYGDRLVACDLSLWRKGTLVVLKTTYDQTQTTSSPALQMRYLVFQEVFAHPEARVIEFYGRVMDWHLKLSDDIRTLYHVTCARWPVLWSIRSLLRGPGRARRPAVSAHGRKGVGQCAGEPSPLTGR